MCSRAKFRQCGEVRILWDKSSQMLGPSMMTPILNGQGGRRQHSQHCHYLRSSLRTLADSLTIIKCKGPIGSLPLPIKKGTCILAPSIWMCNSATWMPQSMQNVMRSLAYRKRTKKRYHRRFESRWFLFIQPRDKCKLTIFYSPRPTLNSVSAEILATIGQDKKQWYTYTEFVCHGGAELRPRIRAGRAGHTGRRYTTLATSMTLVSSESDIGQSEHTQRELKQLCCCGDILTWLPDGWQGTWFLLQHARHIPPRDHRGWHPWELARRR